LGAEPSFDTILADADINWLFLFEVGPQIIATDIYGQNDELLLDIQSVTNNSRSCFLDKGSISPDGKHLLAAYYNERTADTGDIIGRLVLFDFEDNSVVEVPVHLEGFQLAWSHWWLSPSEFMVKMNKFTRVPMTEYKEDGFVMQETVRFLRYDLQHLDSPQLVESAEGLAKSREYDPPFGTMPRVRVEPVIPNAVDGFGRYYDQNWDRSYIFLNTDLVRVSDGSMSKPTWDSDLRLFIWHEDKTSAPYRYGALQMDSEGHYRFWHTGAFWGKIPKGTDN
jgi:hypothetical protein